MFDVIIRGKKMKKDQLFICLLLSLAMMISQNSIARMYSISDKMLDQTYARGLTEMNDHELDKISGQAGFATITRLEDGAKHTVNIDLALDIELYGEIDRLKLGYYDLNIIDDSNTGAKLIFPLNWSFGDDDGDHNPIWDVNFEQVQLGESPDQPVKLEGLKLRLDFEETGRGKALNRLIIGSDYVSGRLYVQRAKSFTGLMKTTLAYDSNFIVKMMPDVWARRSYVLNGESHGFLEGLASPLLGNVGKKGMHFNRDGFHIVIDKDHGVGLFAGFPMTRISSSFMSWE